MNTFWKTKRKKAKDFDLEEAILDGGRFEVLELPLGRAAFKIFSLFVLCAGAVVIGRLVYLGVGRGEFYVFRALANMSKEVVLPSPRGIIFDRFGVPLTENHGSFDVYVKAREFLKEPEPILNALRSVLNLEEGVVSEVIATANLEKSDLVLVAHDITHEENIRLQELNTAGLSIEDSYRRYYPFGKAFAHVLGYVDVEQKGRDGLEAFYNDILRGEDGVLLRHRNAKGEILDEYQTKHPTEGEALYTTLDAGLQEYFFERLSRGLQNIGRTRGAGLVLDPRTGEVLSLVSLPSFDSNLFTSSGSQKEKNQILHSKERPLFNRAISGIYTPGSTIKPLHALAALAEGIITPQKSIFSQGYIEIPNPYNPSLPSRFVDWKPHGWVDVYSALARSSNVYFYEIGGGFGDIEGLGIERLKKWWKMLGLGKKSGIDLPGEQVGLLPDPEDKRSRTGQIWRIGDTYNVSIGQGDLLVTPLQLLNYISAVASGGKIYEPHLNKAQLPRIIADISHLLPQISDVRKGMEDVVREPYGTAFLLHDLPVPAAAKTGSAQIENNKKTNAFFVGYFPAAEPEIAILVLVEDAVEGSLNAVPIARDVFLWYYENRIESRAS